MQFPRRPVAGVPIPSWRPWRLAAGLIVAAAAVASAGPVAAQGPAAPPAPGDPVAHVDAGRGAALTARYHVRQMENVLEHAVQHAADMMRRRLASFTPDVLALAGAPRAQGFRIDGYGLFFSVEVPRLSESVTWALRVLSQDRDERVLASLQKAAAAEADPVVRADLERAMRTIQLQYSTPAGMPVQSPAESVAAARGGAARATMSAAPVGDPAPEQAAGPQSFEPSAAYEDEVKRALVDAVLDYASSLQLPAEEWVTVAARDAGYVAFPDALTDMVTVTLSIRVADLAEFRSQRLTRDEARGRVLVREF